MKRKIKKYEALEWYVIELPRANLWRWNSGSEQWGNSSRYKLIRSWCNETFPKKEWEGKLNPASGISKFVFKEEKYATMFLLKWR